MSSERRSESSSHHQQQQASMRMMCMEGAASCKPVCWGCCDSSPFSTRSLFSRARPLTLLLPCGCCCCSALACVVPAPVPPQHVGWRAPRIRLALHPCQQHTTRRGDTQRNACSPLRRSACLLIASLLLLLLLLLHLPLRVLCGVCRTKVLLCRRSVWASVLAWLRAWCGSRGSGATRPSASRPTRSGTSTSPSGRTKSRSELKHKARQAEAAKRSEVTTLPAARSSSRLVLVLVSPGRARCCCRCG